MYVAQNEEAAYRIIDGKAIILTPDNGMLHTLNSVGTRIWELADGKRRVRDIIPFIFEEFEADPNIVKKDIQNFIEDLVHKKMLIVKNKPFKT